MTRTGYWSGDTMSNKSISKFTPEFANLASKIGFKAVSHFGVIGRLSGNAMAAVRHATGARRVLGW
jgi:hypothetical protein